MELSGLKEMESATADGRWEADYYSSANVVTPKDFLKKLSTNNHAGSYPRDTGKIFFPLYNFNFNV